MKKIYFFPKYSSMGASSRYRIYSYLDYYRRAGYNVEVYPLLDDWYLQNKYNHQGRIRILVKIIMSYIKRICVICKMPSTETIAYIGAELFPGLPYVFEKILIIRRIPYVLEYDDAIFHLYDCSHSSVKKRLLGKRTSKVIEHAGHVICGSRYLYDYCRKFNENVSIIPTCIDKDKYIKDPIPHLGFVIGWIGSPSSSKHIKLLVSALRELLNDCEYTLRLVGYDKKFEFELKGLPYEIVDWKENTEVDEIRGFSVGIMPLTDTPFSRGKCAFKLVQYMAVGIPTISTPLQSNIDIDNNCGNLFATTTEEWIKTFRELINNPQMCKQIGERNKRLALDRYTFQNNWEKYVNIFNSIR